MSGPNAPRQVDAPRPDIRPRMPKPRPADTASFPALLSENDAEIDEAFHAAPFESDGVLGRQLSAQSTGVEAAPHVAEHLEQAAGLPQEAPTNTETEMPASSEQHGSPSMGAPSGGAGARAAATMGARQVDQKPSSSAVLPQVAPQLSPRETRVMAPPSPVRTAAPMAPNRMNANPVFVALHAVEQGCVVYARAGRMSATERENLRHSVRALLAQYGLSSEGIWIDGVEAISGVGADQWPR